MQGQIGEDVETGLECATEEDVTAGATSSHADPCLHPASNFDLNDTAQQQDGYCDWQQAYDDAYGCFYYYCERTQVGHAHQRNVVLSARLKLHGMLQH